ncbi:MAG: hypothetical protein ACHQ51_11210 [Elusimicrobiota bacterium]
MDQPKIPTLKDSQKPQVKVRGLEAGVSLFDRMKQFKKKDLAFILAGLGTLFMAPLAEHFMMSPEGGDATLGQGFGGKNGGKGIFGDGGSVSPYETGVNGQAPGSAVGGGSDVITPLNVRDPSALVMGPGATQQPPTSSVAPSVTPPTAPVTHSDSDLKDALAASARGVGAAAHAAKALLPIPKVALGGSGLHGLGAAAGGSSASAGPITSAGLVTGKANAGGGGLNNVRAMPGYKGVGTRGQSSGSDGMAALKAAGDKAGDVMNRGSAANALDTAAAQQIPTGGNGGGAGEGGMGGGDKAGGGNQDKSSKSVGESLEFLKQKAMQEAKIALWAKEQEAGDNKLELLKMRNSMAEAIAGKLGGAIGDAISCPITPGKNAKKCFTAAADPGYMACQDSSGNTLANISGDAIGVSCDPANGVTYVKVGVNGLAPCSQTSDKGSSSMQQAQDHFKCLDATNGPPAGSTTPPPPGKSVTTAGTGVASDVSSPPVTSLQGACKTLISVAGGLNSTGLTTDGTAVTNLIKQAGLLVSMRTAVGSSADASSGSAGDCGASTTDLASVKTPIIKQLNTLSTTLTGQNQVLDQMDGLAVEKDSKKLEPMTKQVVTGADASNPAIVKSIEGFNTDVKAVVEYGKKLDASILTNKTIVDPSKINQVAGKGGGDKLNADFSSAVSAVDNAYTTMKSLVEHLSVASETDLKPQIDALNKAASSDGTLSQVIARNKAVSDIGTDPKKPDQKLTAPLTPPKMDHQDNDAAGALTPDAVSAADKAIQAANAKVAAYNDPAQTPATEKVAGSPKTTDTQKAIDDAATAVRGLRSGQVAADKTIKIAVTTATGRVGL